MEQPRIVTRDEWVAARKELLVKEKALTDARDALASERRQLPMVKVEKSYIFDTPSGRKTLAELFNGRSQLMIYHFMMGPDWAEGCPSCSFLADSIDGTTIHLAHRDVTLMAVSRAPLANIQAFKQRMGWKFPWASSFGSDFNRDFGVSFTEEDLASGNALYNYEPIRYPLDEAPGLSVFLETASGEVFHTYSTYARGGEAFIGTYHYLDFAPKGRDESGLAFTMAWLRHHDRYDDNYVVDPKRSYADAGSVEAGRKRRGPRASGRGAPRAVRKVSSESCCASHADVANQSKGRLMCHRITSAHGTLYDVKETERTTCAIHDAHLRNRGSLCQPLGAAADGADWCLAGLLQGAR